MLNLYFCLVHPNWPDRFKSIYKKKTIFNCLRIESYETATLIALGFYIMNSQMQFTIEIAGFSFIITIGGNL